MMLTFVRVEVYVPAMDAPDYAPDATSIDALVDGEGRQAPPPTPDEERLASFAPIDAADVTAKLVELLDLAESYVVSGTGTIEDRIRLYVALGEAVTARPARLSEVRKLVGAGVVADLDAPVEVDGRWWRKGRSKSTTAWDKAAVRARINTVVMTSSEDDPVLVDTRTGEPVAGPPAAVAIDRLWKFVDVATSRTKVLREEADVDDEEYAKVEWTDALEPVP